MIIKMLHDASPDDVDYVIRRAVSLGLQAHVTDQEGTRVIGLMGDLRGIDSEVLSGLRGVDEVRSSSRPFRLASREFKSGDSIIDIAGCRIGGEQLVVMAGPCSVESREQLGLTAKAVHEAGAHMLRGGAFKPRSSPYSWQGLAEDGLKILADARTQTGLLVVTEVMSPEQVPLVSKYADVLQVGARNMQNFNLMHALGECRKPILLKRGLMATIEEFLLSAEYILSHGNEDVLLCERGIRTFETYTRNTLDINAVPLLKELTHLPVIVDPSHATGKASLVAATSRAAIAAGADGLIIEVHPNPQKAWSDGAQSLTPKAFEDLMNQVRPVAEAVGRKL